MKRLTGNRNHRGDHDSCYDRLRRNDDRNGSRIVTVGLTPCWDVTCVGRGLEWGQHTVLQQQSRQPAGKALNVSLALDWLGHPSVATGLWGRSDMAAMEAVLRDSAPRVTRCFTGVPGHTRHNVTVVDTRGRGRELHLRARSSLATVAGVRALAGQLKRLLREGDRVVFSGSLPEGTVLAEVEQLLRLCRETGCHIVMDSSGPAMRRLLESEPGPFWLISPNRAELAELLGKSSLRNNPESLVRAARPLTETVAYVLVSCGVKGAGLIGKRRSWWATIEPTHRATQPQTIGSAGMNTVGCGDYLLGGILAQRSATLSARALVRGVQVATARAWGLAGQRSWTTIRREMKVAVREVFA